MQIFREVIDRNPEAADNREKFRDALSAFKSKESTSGVAIEFDKKLRHSQPGLKGEAFLHGQLVPLSEVKWKDENQRKLDGFGAECEGVCGV